MTEKQIEQKLKFYFDYLKLLDLYEEEFIEAFGDESEKDDEVDRILDQIILYKNLQQQLLNKKQKDGK